MGFLSSLFGKKPDAGEAAPDATDHGFLRDIIEIPSRGFLGMSAKSPSGRYTVTWCDGGPDQARKGCYFLLDNGRHHR